MSLLPPYRPLTSLFCIVVFSVWLLVTFRGAFQTLMAAARYPTDTPWRRSFKRMIVVMTFTILFLVTRAFGLALWSFFIPERFPAVRVWLYGQ